MILQNPECICFSQVFIRDLKTFNKNCQLYVLNDFDSKKGWNQINFQNYISAVLNERGKVLILGMEQKKEHFVAKGIKFNSIQ